MNVQRLADGLTEHRWMVAFGCAAMSGYSFRNNMALCDNARDVAMVQGTE